MPRASALLDKAQSECDGESSCLNGASMVVDHCFERFGTRDSTMGSNNNQQWRRSRHKMAVALGRRGLGRFVRDGAATDLSRWLW